MCGLVGGTLFDDATIARALEHMAHRGSDARGVRHYADDGLWLGHNRLAIQGLGSGADQPYETVTTTVIYNGELWRRTMDAYPLYASDTVLLADLYDMSGRVDLVAWARDLDGMFAVAVYDRPRRRIVLVRDRMGRVPLYYAATPDGIAFASEAKALTASLGVGFAGNGLRAQGRGAVKLFPPGCVGVYDLKGKTLRVTPFAVLEDRGAATDDMGAEYYARGLRGRLEAAVANEAIADVPVCTILSGGIDSTVITAILARHVPDLRAYTVAVGPSNGRDDLAYARMAARAIGVPLTEVVLDRADVLGGLEEAVWAVEDDRWVQVAPAVPQIALARRIGADGYKVVFGGEGSDELFGSYGDVRRWAWRPEQYRRRRLELCRNLHDNNLIRGNKACMWGGTVELRTPFLDREVVDWCLAIPPRYRSNDDGRGPVMKPLLREAFRGMVPDELLMRKKVTFQEGAHSDFLKEWKGAMKSLLRDLFT